MCRYRPPELLLNSESYTAAIDIWSVGCIIGEMLGRKPLCPGEDYMDQLRLIVKLLGMPSDKEMEYVEHEKAREYIHSKFSQYKVCTV